MRRQTAVSETCRHLFGEQRRNLSEVRLSAQDGYDTNYAMHALRIGVKGLELLETGRITLPVPEPHRARLRAVRSGAVTLTEVVAELEETAGRLRYLSATANLPPQADADRIDTFLVDAYRRAWSRKAR